jgi:hypothetical protein
MNDIQTEAAFELDNQIPVEGDTVNKQVRARWKQGYRSGRRSVCAELATAIDYDLELRKQIGAAADPFDFLAQWIREFSKDLK